MIAATLSSGTATAEPGIFAAAGPSLSASGGNDWHGDGAIPSGVLVAGYRFTPHVGAAFVGKEGYAAVDQRLLTLVGLGVVGMLPAGDFTPHARFAFVHQHEESWAFVKEEPFGVVFGVGDGIRHRGGVQFAAGTSWTFARSGATSFRVTGELFTDLFVEGAAPGPLWYAGGMLGLGLDHGFE